jgi:hypothetical protein
MCHGYEIPERVVRRKCCCTDLSDDTNVRLYAATPPHAHLSADCRSKRCEAFAAKRFRPTSAMPLCVCMCGDCNRICAGVFVRRPRSLGSTSRSSAQHRTAIAVDGYEHHLDHVEGTSPIKKAERSRTAAAAGRAETASRHLTSRLRRRRHEHARWLWR